MRGMTLLETLAATVLLGVIAAAVLPLVRTAGAGRAPGSAALSEAELSVLVDRVLDDPAGYGVDDDLLSTPGASGSVYVETPVEERIVGLRFEVLVPAERAPDAPHTWVLWAVDDVRTLRWTPLPDVGGERAAP